MSVEQITQTLVTYIALLIEVSGVAAVVIGGALAATRYMRMRHQEAAYTEFRKSLGRAILLGLEFLVAADIIRTVAIRPSYETVLVLAGIVLIRTFLSFSLEVEINGHWPWTRGEAQPRGPVPNPG